MISSFGRGVQVVKEYWEKKGLDVFPLRMNDGSGLAPADKVSAGIYGRAVGLYGDGICCFGCFHSLFTTSRDRGISAQFLERIEVAGKSPPEKRGYYGCQELCRLYHERWKDVCGSRFLE